MVAEPIVFQGIVNNGVIVPPAGVQLPEGAALTVTVSPPVMEAELRAETAAWERASDEAWAKIDEWERQE